MGGGNGAEARRGGGRSGRRAPWQGDGREAVPQHVEQPHVVRVRVVRVRVVRVRAPATRRTGGCGPALPAAPVAVLRRNAWHRLRQETAAAGGITAQRLNAGWSEDSVLNVLAG